jgi:SAM-dependent methyltransferase
MRADFSHRCEQVAAEPSANSELPVSTLNANNPYRRGAGLYDLNLALPFISAIRRQEARAIADLIARYAEGADGVLEVGPGTGFYTLMLARGFREVVAVEECEAMARILSDKLAGAGVDNVTVVNHDFLGLRLERQFDVAVAIGVLDYIPDSAPFVAKLCAAARRAVILTAPQRGLWGACFAAAARLRGIAVYRHHRCAPTAWAPGWKCAVAEVGLKTRFTRGLTLVAALEPQQEGGRAQAA